MKKRLAILEELDELDKDEHEIFDDYIEMVMTFGYITMFASVFTAGAAIIFVFLVIEARSDLFRLESTLKRPLPTKTYNIGTWSIILEIFCYLGVFSNIIICCYASDQVDHLLPWLKYYRDDSGTAVATVFALEHVILVVILLIRIFYDAEPYWVQIFLARRAYKRDLQLSKALSMGDLKDKVLG